MRLQERAVWNSFWHVIALLVFTMVASQAARSPALSRAFLQLVIISAVFQSTYALHQYFVSMPAARAEYLADPDASIQKAQLDAPRGSELRSQYESRLLGSFEPPGTFALTNSLAVLLSGAIVGLGSFALRRSGKSSVSLWLLRGLFLLIVCVWLLTKSRSGFLAVVMVAGSSFVLTQFSKRQAQASPAENRVESASSSRASITRWVIGAVAVFFMMGLAIALLSSDQLVLSEAPKSILYRLEYWQATAKMIVDYPWTGVGLGNFQTYYPAYKLPRASEVIADPHNWLFDLAANCSLPFLAMAVFALGWALRGGMVNWRAAKSSAEQAEDAKARAHVHAFWIGAMTLFLITGGLQLVLGELIDFDATALGAIAATLSWWLLSRYGRTAPPNPQSSAELVPLTLDAIRYAAWLAVITMLVCLLASGSWQASGMALPLSLMLAICNPGERPALGADSKKFAASALVNLAVVVIALVAFVWQTWQPVQSSWALEQQSMAAWQQGQGEQAFSLARQAQDADPLAASPRRLLVQYAMNQAVAAGQRAAAGEFAQAANQVESSLSDILNANPVSNLNCSFAGECNIGLAACTIHWNQGLAIQHMRTAAEHYAQAVERYPTSVALRAQCAVVQAWLDLQGNGQLSAAAQEQLSEAYRLSELTPHTNRQLASQQVYLPDALAAPLDTAAVVRASPDSPWANAEPLCNFLRKM